MAAAQEYQLNRLTELRIEAAKAKDVFVSVRGAADDDERAGRQAGRRRRQGDGAMLRRRDGRLLCRCCSRCCSAAANPDARKTITTPMPKKHKQTANQLLSGTAEIFGAELSLGQRVNVAGHAVAVFTWDGCSLSVEGDPDVA